MYFVYMLRCRDNSLYTGITSDLERRFSEHKEKKGKGAKYTRSHEPVSVEAAFETENKGDALRLEIFLKSLSKDIKERIISDEQFFFLKFGEKFPCERYLPISRSLLTEKKK